MTTEFQWIYNGLTIGDSTDIDVASAQGLGLPDVRSGDTPKALAHGEFAGLDLAAGRTIVLEIEAASGSDADQATQIAALQAAFTVQALETPLTFMLPGEVAKRINCRTRRRAFTADVPLAVGRLVRMLVELRATDPRIYADAESLAVCAFPTGAGAGMTFPLTFNLSFGGASTGGLASAVNDGTFGAPWVCVIAGPVTDPIIANETTGESLRFEGTVSAGDSLVIDSTARTVLLNGTASRYSWLKAGSQWFDINPGANTLRFSGASGTGSTASFTWRSAWL